MRWWCVGHGFDLRKCMWSQTQGHCLLRQDSILVAVFVWHGARVFQRGRRIFSMENQVRMAHLRVRGQSVFPGCRECMAKKWPKSKHGFAAGKYTINQYFYERTLVQQAYSAIHKAHHEAEEPAQPEPDRSEPASPLEHTPPGSSPQSSEPASSDRKSCLKTFSNVMLAVYCLHGFWSSAPRRRCARVC